MENYRDFFRRYFPLLSGHEKAFQWQERLFERFCAREIPRSVDIPTGCGKTSVMSVWLLALAYASRGGNALLPRRLVWIVNRRVVVDQATEEAVAMALRLDESGLAELREVRTALFAMYGGSGGRPFGISTLRGQFADNAEWRNDPARPAIITGTVDMIGSRLLFSGYGCGFKSRPLHAGLLGQDALLVHDEAHLEPAFQSLVEAIEHEQRRSGDFLPLRTIQLTATARATSGAFSLSREEMDEGEMGVRVNARKGMSLHPVAIQKELPAETVRQALKFRESGSSVLVFLRRLADVESVYRQLEREGCGVQRLTGTLRGYERDRLMLDDMILARFLPGSHAMPKEGTVYLVSTSAGEVGVNLSADHAVCDLAPFDSVTQRLGRVNRFGKGDARIELVHGPIPEKPTPLDEACARTLTLLKELPRRTDGRVDCSPSALGQLDAERRLAAFTPSPEILPVSDILFDRWALTTIRGPMPGRPPVADWLHGVESEPPQTYVAWRHEVEILTETLLAEYDPSELLEDFPVKPHELLRASSKSVTEALAEIAERTPELRLWIVEVDGEVRVAQFGDFSQGNDRQKRAPNIGDRMILLPPAAGGLQNGSLAGAVPYSDAVAYDISIEWADEKGLIRRMRVWDDEEPPDGMRLVQTLDLQLGSEIGDEEHQWQRFWYWYVRPQAADDDGSRLGKARQELAAHCLTAQIYADRLAGYLRLPEVEKEALRSAAIWHDRGKDREVWQRSIGNREYPRLVLAKSAGKVPPIPYSGYRHEFGSLLDMGPKTTELSRHMVAAHHGRARPHFPDDEVFDPNYSDEVAGRMAEEVPVRFVQLQREYGRWGLAYVESLLRVVDAWASQTETPARQASA